MLWILTAIIASYLIGSIPSAYIFCRALKGIDIRTVGSGNVGATNALRVLGKKWGIFILFLDILKGLLPVLLLGNITISKTTLLTNEQLRFLIGLSCISGHNWTVFLSFKGGKGIATTLGTLIGFACTIPGLNVILSLLILTWLLIFILSKTVSLASIATSALLPVYAGLFRQSRFLIIASLVLSLFAIIRHKTNIIRLLNGTEPRLKFKKK
ncbi:MAG: glycerol-3-phosphate 1-O-acyltransferase PlsY [Candidatus Omnitrophica bacterium]|nr:glycerol-3-phosphate 1-O-acyltransferase PlsY [Candidatus Omnitrophota bacterium]